MLRFLLLGVLLLFSQYAQAQLSKGGSPYSSNYVINQKPATFTTSSVDVKSLLEEDEIDLSYNLPLRFAFGHQVDISLENNGSWINLANGDRLWRLQIKCPEALNVNLLYDDFYLPQGASLYLYGAGKKQILGAFTSENNKASGKFATALVHGSELTLEYYEPAAVNGLGRISIAQIAHGYRDLDGKPDEGQEKMSGDCQVDVNCSEGANWQIEKKGVAKIVMDGLYLCTGTLINNTANDCKPLFLTANHCLAGGIVQDAVVNPDVSGYVFYWNFEVPECGAAGPTPEQTTSGGTVLANSGLMTTGTHTLLSSDFALIQLNESPRGAYDVYFNGWDASGEPGNTGVGIHHPAGDVKKISTHHIIPSEDGYYWSLFWDATENGHSVTEGGSSGSALFRENGLIIGQLFGGGSVNCDDPANDRGLYGKLSYSWTNDDEPVLTGDSRRRLLDWLDPIGQGDIRSSEGSYAPCETKRVFFKTTEADLTEEAVAQTDGCRSYADYTFELGITPYPRDPVTVMISGQGSADAGNEHDYEILTSEVAFNNVTNSATFAVRIYDDAYVENDELLELSLTPIAYGIDEVDLLAGAEIQLINIPNNDSTPNNHVQQVRNIDNPAQEYLGPNATVYFTVPGSGGMLARIENLTNHNYGCVEVLVDNAGGTANNDYPTGTALSKTLAISTEFPASAAISVQLYYGENELNGWEWFNNEGLDRSQLQLIQFEGPATPNNSNSATMAISQNTIDYGNDFIYQATLEGLFTSINGIALGRLSNIHNLGSIENGVKSINGVGRLTLAPNITRNVTSVIWNATQQGNTRLLLQNTSGQIVHQQEYESQLGFNSYSLDVANLHPGIYWVRLSSENEQYELTKLIVQ